MPFRFVDADRDTVSSIGIVRGKSLPLTESCDHICYFRHALALDERRVKFLPEYVTHKAADRMKSMKFARVKEVWFAGCHSDVYVALFANSPSCQMDLILWLYAISGGGSVENENLDLKDVPLLWMENEAVMAGLHLKRPSVEWKFDHLQHNKPHESLNPVWWLFELLPFRRASHSDPAKTSR